MARNKVLIVDDDIPTAHAIRDFLKSEGFDSYIALDGEQALTIIDEKSPALVILDIILPGLSGFQVLERIRLLSDISVIALSARCDAETKIKCLRMGADDYLTKPFNIRELSARIDSVLRRVKNAAADDTHRFFQCNELSIDYEKRKVLLCNNEIQLTPTQYCLLTVLTLNADRILTYEYLLKNVWGTDYSSEKQYLHVFIGQLRSKIEKDPQKPEYVETIPRVGYRFNTGGSSNSETISPFFNNNQPCEIA